MTAHEPLAFYLAAKNGKSAKRRDRTEPPGRTVESWVHLELRIPNVMLMSFIPVLSLRSLRSLRLNPSPPPCGWKSPARSLQTLRHQN